MLSNMVEGLINSTTLLENSIWQIFSESFLKLFGGIASIAKTTENI